ncbi:hypothetical protein [Nocardia lijiangensis]|uniref:hypothetical protein n=1 Tax=Nocardia lijiangensis TaxID=299618 RepID=UPI00082A269E|nr:hypothetical protein [Nocardia lijiangensis]
MALKDVWLAPVGAEAWPKGLYLMGEIAPVLEFSSDRNAKKRQEVDLNEDGTGTGKRLWKGTVSDPTAMGAKNSSFDVVFVADVQPVPAAAEIAPGITPIELEGAMVKPRVVGNGEYKSIGWYVRASGIKGDTSGAKQVPADPGAARQSKAA